ncbi:MAG: hypothetical protein ACPG19_06385 [Saprospiraceae bacterium]
MRHQKFFGQLAFCFGLSVIVIALLNYLPVLQAHQLLSWLSLLFFTIISLAAYFFGIHSANSSNKNDFNNVFIILTTTKLLLSLFLVWFYQIFTEPTTKLFILPFFLIYIIFTIFESYILIRLGKDGEL